LAIVNANAELTQAFKDNAEIGAGNLSGALPLLKIHATGRSSTNELADGSEPEDGYFFYKPTQEQFPEVTCHILTISRGFRSPGVNDQEKKEVFNQIMSGVIIEENELKPFMMYFTGLKLQNLWNFGKEASKYTKGKPLPIPMFALTVKMTTEKITNSFGKSWIVNFEIAKDENKALKIVTDMGLFQFLKDHVLTMEETIENIIRTKTNPEGEEGMEERPVEEVTVNGEAMPF